MSFEEAGGNCRFDWRCFATSARMDSFFAFEANAVSAFVVTVVERKMSVYALMSAIGGASF